MSKNREEGKRWLDQAEQDLKSAQWSQKGGFFETACFLSQQAAEKALKAFLYLGGERQVVGHSVLKLLRQCGSQEKKFLSFEEEAKLIDRLYIPTRYPNGIPDNIPHEYFGEKDAEQSIASARTVIDLSKTFFAGT